MTPSDYAREIVMPTVREFMTALDDRRRAYLACIVTYHLVDYVAKAEGLADTGLVITKIRGHSNNAEAAFDVVQGICNGSKHCGRNPKMKPRYLFTPGSERPVAPLAYGVSGAYGDGRYGGFGGLWVPYHGGKILVDDCVRFVLDTFGRLYPQHFAGVDLKAELPRR